MGKNQIFLATTGLLIATSLLTACGASKTTISSNTSASTSDDTTTASTELAVANCSTSEGVNSDPNKSRDTVATLSAFKDASGVVSKNLFYLKLQNAPEEWKTENYELRVFRWTQSPNGAVTLDQKPLDLMPFVKRNGGWERLGPTADYKYPAISWAVHWQNPNNTNQGFIPYAQAKYGSANSLYGATVTDLMTNFSMLIDVKDTAGTYKALRVVFYTTSGAVAREVDLLIPSYYADPTEHANGKGSLISELHPLKDQTSQGWSQADYLSMTQGYCLQ